MDFSGEQAYLTAIVNLSQFFEPKQLAVCLGLILSTRPLAIHRYHGRITIQEMRTCAGC